MEQDQNNQAVVETYTCFTAGQPITGWTVKVGDDCLADFETEEEAKAYAESLNLGGVL